MLLIFTYESHLNIYNDVLYIRHYVFLLLLLIFCSSNLNFLFRNFCRQTLELLSVFCLPTLREHLKSLT